MPQPLQHFVHRVVMVDAVGKPDALRIFDELLEIIGIAIAAVRADHRGEQLSNTQVVLEILVIDDVAARKRCLRQVVGQFLFPERQCVEARHLVT
jgi:hypothetical protein